LSSVANIVDRSERTAWHALTANQAVDLLDSNTRSGLTGDEVSRLLEEFGRNRLPEGSKKGAVKRFLLQLNNSSGCNRSVRPTAWHGPLQSTPW
jgi:magnesium-transporting ATPase (P-type)